MTTTIKKTNNKHYSVLILLTIFAIALFTWLSTPSSTEKYVNEHCPNYEIRGGFADQTEFIDCKNSIGIEKYTDDNFYTVFIDSPIDKEMPSNNVLYTTKNKFVFSGNSFFYIEDVDLDTIAYSRNGNSYITTLKIKDKSEIMSFPSKDDIPLFRKIDSITGNFTLYKTINNVPESERLIFERLLK